MHLNLKLHRLTSIVFTTGGMPPLVDHPDDVYKALYGMLTRPVCVTLNFTVNHLPHFSVMFYILTPTFTEKVKERNETYYKKYPQDIKRVRDILKHLKENEVILPNSGHLTPRRFLQLGLAFGGTGA